LLGQSLSCPQLPWQAVLEPLHGVELPQAVTTGPGHVAVPLQNSWSISCAFGTLPLQLAARQMVMPAGTGVWHLPPLHTSYVQTLPSLPHALSSAIAVNTQPLAGLHESVVHASPSLQTVALPGTQLPPEQVSPVVQALPSEQLAVLFACVQPVAGLQESSVQGFESLQFSEPVPPQVPPEQVSEVVQALPSLQLAVLFACVQPVAGLQESSVQGFESLQFGAAPPTHAPPEQVSEVVQALPSLQEAVLFVWVQPVAGLQESLVQGFESSQFGAAPPTQVPPEHVSEVVQALPSLQEAVLFVWVQPVAGLQESLVQGFESSQLGAAPPTQEPPEHVSFVVQALPSLQLAVLFVWTQPVAGLHESSVQPFESLQLVALPLVQTPPEQVSPVVQALPSSQEAVLLVWTQPVEVLQESLVHGFASLQFGADPPTHVPPEQVSFVVQALPSSQEAVLLVWTQPVEVLQESLVHGFASLQFRADPPTHVPPEQTSPVVQALPSLQDAVLFVCTQPVAGLQESSVQAFASLQLTAVPTQLPPEQVSPVVQALPSLHGDVLLV
jgi:hypothetical protein